MPWIESVTILGFNVRYAALALILSAALSEACGSSPAPSGPHVAVTFQVGKRAGTPVVGGGYTWVPNTADGTITKIDQGSNRVVATLPIGDANRLYRERCGELSSTGTDVTTP